MNPKRRIAALGAAAALVLAGCGAESATTTSTAATGTQAQSGRQGGPMDLSALAEKLGVSTEKLQAAMQDSRPQAGEQPSGSPGDMAADLAQELGLSESKVQAALDALMPQGAPPDNGGEAPSATPSGATSSS